MSAVAAPVPQNITDAIQQIKASDGFRPREAFYLMEQETPRLAGDAEARKELAVLLSAAVNTPDIQPNAKTVLEQYLYQVATDAVPVVQVKPPEAKDVYLAKASHEQPAQRIAALSALAGFYPADATAPCVKALKDADAKVRATAALCLMRRDLAILVKAVPPLDTEAQVSVLDALTGRKAEIVRDLAVQLSKSDDAQVRAAALRLRGTVANMEDVTFLAEQGMVEALVQLTGEGVDEAIFELLETPGKTASRIALVNAAALRNAEGMTEALLELLEDADGKVRVAAAKALGRFGDVSAYPAMLEQGIWIVALADSRDVAEEAVKLMGRRIPDRQARLKPLFDSLDSMGFDNDVAPDVIQVMVMRLLVPLGGDDEALAFVRERVNSPVESVQDTAVRALCEWPDAAAFPDLQKIAADENASKTHRTLAERAVEKMRTSWTRFSALAYMNCGGPEKEAVGKDGVKLRFTGCDTWTFTDSAEGTVFFAGDAVQAEVTGLTDGKDYQISFTWWDYDANGRVQSVWVNGRMVLEPTALPNFKDKQEAAVTLAVVVPGGLVKGGKADIRFKRDGGRSNALVSELWIGPAPEGAEAKLPEPPEPRLGGDAVAPPAVKANAGAPKKILILTGMEHHNNWQQNTPTLTAAFAEDKRLEISVSENPMVMTKPEVLAQYDGFVLYYNNSDQKPPPEGALGNLVKAVEADGKGLVMVHFASGAFYDWEKKAVDPAFTKIAGRVWNSTFRAHDAHGTFTVNIADKEHPITKGLADFETMDELYTCLDGEAPIHVLATAVSKEDQKVYPMAFVLNPGKGRTFHCALGHDAKAFNAKALELFRRGTVWSVGLE